MNQEVKAQWVAALRGGEYEQGRDRLVSIKADGSKAYCCLGVLCDLAVEAGVQVTVAEREWRHSDGVVAAIEYDDQRFSPPSAVLMWAGVGSPIEGFLVPWGDDRTDVANLNDDGQSFATIADLIEGQL